MEIILNLAWAVCSLMLIWFWIRSRAFNPAPLRMQILAIAMVVLLLLPVISLSDDLMAMQGLAETDNSARRANNPNGGQPSVIPTSLTILEQAFSALPLSGYSLRSARSERLSPPAPGLTRSLDRRPPPQA